MARIIHSLSSDGQLNKTRLSVTTGMAYDRLVNYLEWMKGKDLVVEVESYVRLTEKGMNSYNKFVDWVIENVGKLDFHRNK